jgi:predicted nucleic acid-binding protein
VRAILNASPIIAILDEVGDPRIFVLLADAGWEFLVPVYIEREEIQKPPGRAALLELIATGVVKEIDDPSETDLRTFLSENPNLDNGESCVILLCHSMGGRGLQPTAVLDDGPARKKAQELDLTVIGTLGLLTWLEKRNVVSGEEAQGWRKALASSPFRIGGGVLVSKEEEKAR